MKNFLIKLLVIMFGALIVLVIGSILLGPLHSLYWDFMEYGGYDDENRVLKILLFVQSPVLLILGGLVGRFIYRKYW